MDICRIGLNSLLLFELDSLFLEFSEIIDMPLFNLVGDISGEKPPTDILLGDLRESEFLGEKSPRASCFLGEF